jgi:hypothetical protein
MQESRTYSIFVKANGKYIRLSAMAYRKSAAVRIFQNMLLYGSMQGFLMYLRLAEDVFADESLRKMYDDNRALYLKIL